MKTDNSPRRKLPLWKKLAFTVVVLVPAFLVLELVLGLCGYYPPNPLPNYVRKVSRYAFGYFAICDRRLGFRNRPLSSFRSPCIVGHPLSTTDKYGYRNGFGWSPDGSKPIVIFVGDSITFCSEVADDQTGPSEVAKLLSKEFDVRVLNAGVRGYNTLQAKRMLEECLARYDCIQAVIYTYCGNDLEGNMVANLYFPALAPVVARDEFTGNLREIEVSDPAVAWGENFLDWQPRSTLEEQTAALGGGVRLAKWLDTHSAVWHHSRVGLGQAFPQPKGPSVQPGGCQMIPCHEYSSWHRWASENGGHEILRRLLVEMLQLCRTHDVAFLATAYNTREHHGCAVDFAEDCDAQKIPYVDMLEYFPGDSTAYTCRRVDGRNDAHFGVLGTKCYAAALTPPLTRILRARRL